MITFNESVEYIISRFDDIEREGLKETATRYHKFLREFMNPEPFEFTTFNKEEYDEMVIVKDIPFYSICEHHLAPFFGMGHIAYLPNHKICGISKLPRTLDMFARRFQNQERITTQVAEFIEDKLQPRGVAVVLEARHMCMEMRGIKKPGSITITSKLTGMLKQPAARTEFFNLINNKK